jgi:hypothetical protein
MAFARFPLVRLGVAALALANVSCTPPNPDDANPDDANPDDGERHTGVSQSAIKDGYEDVDDTAVMALTKTNHLCSGSLIAPNVLLTARHCVSTINTGTAVTCDKSRFGAVQKADDFHVSAAAELLPDNINGYAAVEVVGLAGIPGIPPSVENDVPVCGNDMAIVILAENVPASVAVPYEPVLEGPLGEGLSYYAVGYGAVSGSGDDAGKRRRRDDLTITCEGTDACVDLELNDVADEEWVGSGGVCSGDSGGPALSLEDQVVGVTSRGDSTCEISVYASTAAHAQWIKNTTVFAAGMGNYEPPAWTAGATVDPANSKPVGAACSDGGQCPAGICVPDESGGYCSRPCTDEAPCPTGYECSNDGEAVCVKKVPAPPVGAFKRAPKDGCTAAGTSSDRDSGGSWGIALMLAAWWSFRKRCA